MKNREIIDRDFWNEVISTVKQQKWRSVMTAFGVFWGLLILMLLIGAGMGFREGMVGQLKKMPSNSVGYITSATTMPCNGFERGRRWNIEDADLKEIDRTFPGAVERSVLVKFLPSEGSSLKVTREDAYDDLAVVAVSPFYGSLAPQRVVSGRYLNDFDCIEQRKVCVIGDQVARTLFPEGESPVGSSIKIEDAVFEVVGVTRKTNAMVNFSANESQSVFIPITTGQYMYDCVGKTDYLFMVLDDRFPSGEFCGRIGSVIRTRHSIHPDDDAAIIEMDLKSQLNQFDIMVSGLNALVWLVGLGTLLAGLIGISNIMMVTVKERTQEIGVRRALGTKPWAIIKQIMSESLLLTFVAGISGIIVGVWGMYIINRITASALSQGGFFANPYVPFVPAVAALLILVAGGLGAGYFPARRAMKVKAIDALRYE